MASENKNLAEGQLQVSAHNGRVELAVAEMFYLSLSEEDAKELVRQVRSALITASVQRFQARLQEMVRDAGAPK